MIKSSAPVFVVLFAVLFKLEEPSYRIFIIIGIICVGVLLMVSSESQEVNFDLSGYLQVQFAAVFSGLRWSLTNILLLRTSMGMTLPIITTYYLAPIVSLTLFIGFLIFEGPTNLLKSAPFQSPAYFLNILGMLGLGGVLAFLMVLIEFKLISITSVVTFTVAGIAKEIITIVLAQWIYKDKITPLEILGLIISIVGILLYNHYKIYHKSDSNRHNGDIPLQNLNNDYREVDFEIDYE
jgi:solute carrier family 35 protein C2